MALDLHLSVNDSRTGVHDLELISELLRSERSSWNSLWQLTCPNEVASWPCDSTLALLTRTREELTLLLRKACQTLQTNFLLSAILEALESSKESGRSGSRKSAIAALSQSDRVSLYLPQ